MVTGVIYFYTKMNILKYIYVKYFCFETCPSDFRMIQFLYRRGKKEDGESSLMKLEPDSSNKIYGSKKLDTV